MGFGLCILLKIYDAFDWIRVDNASKENSAVEVHMCYA